MFFSLPGLSVEGYLALLEGLDCNILLETQGSRSPLIEEVLSKRPMEGFAVPDLDYWLQPGDNPRYPFLKTFAQARDKPFVCLHTSGSTGLPKVVTMKHGTMTHHILFSRLPSLGGNAVNLAKTSGTRIFFGLPLSHSAGMCSLAYSIYSKTTIIFASSYPVTANTANQAHLHAKVQGSFLGPNVLHDLVLNSEYIEAIKRLDYLTFGGAALSKEVGKKLEELTYLFLSFGATEIGFYPLEGTDPGDWEYARFGPLMGIELRPYGQNLFELHFIRQETLQDFQGVFSTFPSISQCSPKDIYAKHPTKENLWLYEGRSDDMIVLSQGLNFNPAVMQRVLQAHPLVAGAIVYGQKQARPSLLIEARVPPKTTEDRYQLLQEVWPSVERANNDAPVWAKLTRE